VCAPSKVAKGRTDYRIVQGEPHRSRVRRRVVEALGRTPDPAVALEEMRRKLAGLRKAGALRRRIERLEARIGDLAFIVDNDLLV
jgi:hypothetical protein